MKEASLLILIAFIGLKKGKITGWILALREKYSQVTSA